MPAKRNQVGVEKLRIATAEGMVAHVVREEEELTFNSRLRTDSTAGCCVKGSGQMRVFRGGGVWML